MIPSHVRPNHDRKVSGETLPVGEQPDPPAPRTTLGAMSEPVVVEAAIAAPAERVWRALREPHGLGRRHGWEHDGLDKEIRQIYLDDVTSPMRS
jgi:hypothetical protein